jgi:uncharacterized alkaline shock family protein YloU
MPEIYTISPNIVRDIARLTTLATPGVMGLVDTPGMLGRTQYRGVEVSMDGEARAQVQLRVSAAADQSLHALGRHIQQSVAEAVDEMTGIHVTRVDVTFEDIRSLS